MERKNVGTVKLPLFRQYAVTLIERINSGAYVEKLPPEPDLVVESSLSRGTVRAALAILEAKGVITRFSGRGTFINTKPLDLAREANPEYPFANTLHRLTSIIEDTTIPETVKNGLIKVINAQLDLVEQLENLHK